MNGLETQRQYHQTIILQDRRALGFSEYGDLSGKPVLEFHGNPSSRLGAVFFDDAAMRLGVRVIGVDRPGMGLSDYQPERRLLDWPEDILDLASALNLQRFAIIGGSGGVPSALACAFKIPERLTKVGIMFGPAPPHAKLARIGWSVTQRMKAMIARNAPVWISALALRSFAHALKTAPDRALARLFRDLPAADIAALEQSHIKMRYVDAMLEAFRSGTRGAALDFALNMRPWGFSPNTIPTKIDLWHGEEDTITPPILGRFLASSLPNCEAHFIPGEGHFSMLPNHAGKILERLVSTGP